MMRSPEEIDEEVQRLIEVTGMVLRASLVALRRLDTGDREVKDAIDEIENLTRFY